MTRLNARALGAQAIRLSGVHKRFEDRSGVREVLCGVCLEVARGEFVAVSGPSGSGKSTLLNVIAAVEPADAGEIWAAGMRVDALREPQCTLYRRREVGIVFQFFNLVPTLTVGENLALPLELLGLGEVRERARAMLRRLSLEARIDSFPEMLSGGEQQRVAVARAMIHRPAIVLADEPTGNLDTAAGESVVELLREAAADGAAVVMATHDSSAAAAADRRLALADGRL